MPGAPFPPLCSTIKAKHRRRITNKIQCRAKGKIPQRLAPLGDFLNYRNSIDVGRTWDPTRWGGVFAPYKRFAAPEH